MSKPCPSFVTSFRQKLLLVQQPRQASANIYSTSSEWDKLPQMWRACPTRRLSNIQRGKLISYVRQASHNNYCLSQSHDMLPTLYIWQCVILTEFSRMPSSGCRCADLSTPCRAADRQRDERWPHSSQALPAADRGAAPALP